eukprot:gene32378-2570_t
MGSLDEMRKGYPFGGAPSQHPAAASVDSLSVSSEDFRTYKHFGSRQFESGNSVVRPMSELKAEEKFRQGQRNKIRKENPPKSF